jgi:seryl-tRNA synthetase
MIDINHLYTDIQEYKDAALAKNKTIDFDRIISLDTQRKSLQTTIDDLKFQQKTA